MAKKQYVNKKDIPKQPQKQVANKIDDNTIDDNTTHQPEPIKPNSTMEEIKPIDSNSNTNTVEFEMPELEQPQTDTIDPLHIPKIENDYTTTGIKKPQTSSENKTNEPLLNKNTESVPNDTIPNNNINTNTNDFNAEEPPPSAPDDAGQQTINNGEPTSPFNIPTGSANDMIDFGAQTLNYAIGNFAGIFTDVRILPQFYKIKDIVPTIKEHNTRNVEKLKLTSEEIEMLRKPLLRIMKEKGIAGLTAGEELMTACVIIIVAKIKVVIEIRRESAKLEKNIKQMIDDRFGPSETKTPEKEEELPLTPVEEVV